MPRPMLAIRSGGLLCLALLLTAGECVGSARRSEVTIERDVLAHLEATYDEPFVVTRLRTRSNVASGFVHSRGFDAHPVADAELSFTGLARYDVDPPRFSDRYRCAQVARWLPGRVADVVGAPRRVRHANLRCAEGLPPHPAADEPLPSGSHRLRLTVELFHDGDLSEVVTAARSAMTERASEYGVSLQGHVVVFPAALWPHTERTGVPSDPSEAADWDWLERGRAPLQGDDSTRSWIHHTDIEEAIGGWVRDRAGEGARVRVSAVGHTGSGHARIDVRVSAPELDQERMRAITDGVARAHPGHLLHVRGGGAAGSFVCQAPPASCQRASGALLPPDWDGTRSTTDAP